jgi:copper chaperone CopZ
MQLPFKRGGEKNGNKKNCNLIVNHNIMKHLLSLVLIVSCLSLYGQTKGNQKAVIQTNGVCEMCKTRFMETVPYFKGVADVSYDMKTAQLTVMYNPDKTTVEAIRKGVSDLGYDADNVKANPEARKKLPACCRADKSSHGQGHSHGHEGCGGHTH